METIGIGQDEFPEIWAMLQPPDSAPQKTIYYVAQTYPAPRKASGICFEDQVFEDFASAHRCCESENMGRDYSTVAVCVFRDGKLWALRSDGSFWKPVISPIPEYNDYDPDEDDYFDWDEDDA